MTCRRAAIGLITVASAIACGQPRVSAQARAANTVSPQASPRLHLDPLVDLVPAAHLLWLVDARPAQLLADDAVADAVAIVLPASRLDAWARHYGGVDLRQARELDVGGYPQATLALARAPIDPHRVEAAFVERSIAVEGRSVDASVTRFWGTVAGGDREQMALFGSDAVAVERGHLGPLRPAIYFAQGKLKRASPALRAEPLAAAAARLGNAPLRAFAAGPFDGGWGAGLGGLMRAATAVAAAATPTHEAAALGAHLRIVLMGSWGAEAGAAAERLAAAFERLANDPLGHLLGLDQPVQPAVSSGDRDALALDVVIDPVTLARGLHAVTEATIAEILSLSPAH